MKPLTSVLVLIVVVALLGGVRAQFTDEADTGEVVTVVHWSTGHLLRDGSGLHLLRQMADDFHKMDPRTADGRRIRVQLFYVGGADQAPDLASRVTTGIPRDNRLPDPTLVTPSASHWLVNVNYAAGREVIDLHDTLSRSLARSYVGIVTYRDMAECLGWPAKAIGYADIIALRNDPRGWSAYSCAKAEWGEKPLFAFTDPQTSDTGRAVLLTLYAMAAGKEAQDLTEEDIRRPEVVESVRGFQRLVDHYMISTIPLNTKVYQGPRYGHFFIMPEDNLIHLVDGTESAIIDGVEVEAPPITRPMVMIYPKEGSLLRENCACAVKADWVSPEEAEATEQWVRFLREDRQQAYFMAAGFRPGTNLTVGEPISGRNGLDPSVPAKTLYAERVPPKLAHQIDESWGEVKRPGILTVVLDTSGSMEGEKLMQAKKGMIEALDIMAQNNRVGFLSFASGIGSRVDVGPLSQTKFRIASTVDQLKANGGTHLYDAILEGIRMSDTAEGDPDAIRGVLVLTDGMANVGSATLDNFVRMASRNEVPVATFRGLENDTAGQDLNGRVVAKKDITGTSLALSTTHKIQVFFIGVGDADLDIGRILAQATGAEYRGATLKELAQALSGYTKYF